MEFFFRDRKRKTLQFSEWINNGYVLFLVWFCHLSPPPASQEEKQRCVAWFPGARGNCRNEGRGTLRQEEERTGLGGHHQLKFCRTVGGWGRRYGLTQHQII